MANRRVDTGIIQRGKSYTFTVALGMDINGKQIRKTRTWTPPEGVTVKKADKLAKEAYIEFKNQCRGLSALNENMRFKELTEEYFKVYAPHKLKPSTAIQYKRVANFRLIEYFGNKKLRDITQGMLSDYFCNLKNTKYGDPVALAPGSARQVYIVMQSVFSFAVSQKYIKESPCKGVILPGEDVRAEKKRKSLTEEELPRFLSLFEGYSPLNTMIKTLLYTGVRSGELRALQWEDIDFEKRTIYIRHTLTDCDGKRFLTTPKSKTSRRIIFMSSSLYEILKEHQAKQRELIFALGKAYPRPEIVFPSVHGDYLAQSSFSKSLRTRLRGTGFEFISPHCLRHSNATLLLNSGVDIKVVSEHLGHSDIGVTADVYTDVLNSMRRKTAEILEFKIAQ